MNNNELEEQLLDFLKYFKEVFDKDWEYSKSMMGIRDTTKEEKENLKKHGLEDIPIINENGTFINPMVDDEDSDWAHRALLLNSYRKLIKQMERENH